MTLPELKALLARDDAEAVPEIDQAMREHGDALIACAEALRNGIGCGQIVGGSKLEAQAALRALEAV